MSSGSEMFSMALKKLYHFMKTETFTDVTLSVGGRHFAAHKLMLSVHSPVFEAMFSNAMLEATTGIVTIDDVKPDIFEKFLCYMYTGRVDPRTHLEEMIELFVCADKYGVTSLTTACESLLHKKTSVKNVVDIYLLAESYKRPVLCKRAVLLMSLRMEEVVTTESWNLIKDDPVNLRKIVTGMCRRNKQLSNLGFDEPLRKRRCTLGSTESKVVIKVDRNKMNHLRPQEIKSRPSNNTFPDISGYVILNEDKMDGNRLVVTLVLKGIDNNAISKHSLTCEVSVVSEDDVVIHGGSAKIYWQREDEHPSMGSSRYIVYEGDGKLPKTGLLYFELRFIPFDAVSIEFPSRRYEFDDGGDVPHALDSSKDFVRITCGDNEWKVPLEYLGWRTRHLLDSKGVLDSSDSPRDSLDKLIRYMFVRKMPSRDAVDLPLLIAACKLRMDYGLISYLEHALVWDLDPWNCLDMIEVGSELGLGFLKHGALLYFNVYSDRIVNSCPETWDKVKPSVLTEILLDLNWGKLPERIGFLPKFLISSLRRDHYPKELF